MPSWSIAQELLKLVTFDRSLLLLGALLMTMVGVVSISRARVRRVPSDVLRSRRILHAALRYSTTGAAIAVVLGAGLETNLRAGLLLMRRDVSAGPGLHAFWLLR